MLSLNIFIKMALHNKVGHWGEQLAVEFLMKQGYIIRERNWRLNKLEIDIVAEYNNRIVIVEVKTRTDDFSDPVKSVDRRKQLYLINAGNGYINHFNIDKDMQFDVITIVGTPENYKLEHIPDAFLPTLRTY